VRVADGDGRDDVAVLVHEFDEARVVAADAVLGDGLAVDRGRGPAVLDLDGNLAPVLNLTDDDVLADLRAVGARLALEADAAFLLGGAGLGEGGAGERGDAGGRADDDASGVGHGVVLRRARARPAVVWVQEWRCAERRVPSGSGW